MRTRLRLLALAMALVVVTLTGCRPTYTGYESDIDGVLWRQIHMRLYYLSGAIYEPRSEELYIHDTRATVWDGESPADELGIPDSAVIIWDLEHTDHRYTFQVFVSSGPRPDRPDDNGRVYTGPHEIFTCFGITATFVDDGFPEVERHVDVTCPQELVDQMPGDAGLATLDVFDG